MKWYVWLILAIIAIIVIVFVMNRNAKRKQEAILASQMMDQFDPYDLTTITART